MNERNILALYPDRDEAERVKARLKAVGISEADIEIYHNERAGGVESLVREAKAFSEERERLETFAEGVSRGNVLLTAKVGDESAHAAFTVLQGTVPLDVDAVEGALGAGRKRKAGAREH